MSEFDSFHLGLMLGLEKVASKKGNKGFFAGLGKRWKGLSTAGKVGVGAGAAAGLGGLGYLGYKAYQGSKANKQALQSGMQSGMQSGTQSGE